MRILIATGMPSHWKLRRLGTLLKDPNAGMYVIRLWTWAFTAGPGVWRSGSLKGFSPREIADVCEFDGPPGLLLAALLRTGLLDKNPLRIHDWRAHNGSARVFYETEKERQRLVRHRRKRAAAAAVENGSENVRSTVLRTSGVRTTIPVRSGSGSGSGSGSVERRSRSTTTTSSSKQGGRGAGRGGGGGLALTGWAERIWEAWPLHKRAPECAAGLTEAIAELALTDAEGMGLLELIEKRKTSGEWTRESGRFVRRPAVWLLGEGREWLRMERKAADRMARVVHVSNGHKGSGSAKSDPRDTWPALTAGGPQ